ncbi:ATP-binding cassette, subfamily B, multidrug efflux pump [Palleronia marisminoris]|uniref:Putative multidrug export ATP-binding/permease protein n=1 Tax=Palleronia marisminoris TaxID=315423 RepID=A0A1Y5SZR2_9RHOB|nr:ABC transporter ATP-binding protein [Palleronia marisminoris]SFH05358.1 ATP-binding cassette, subfamily B, multidrug efflux pump [Palleronia marisminoris]SLN50692.1 Putative multidrug export ATP-binding/permease protein [Palleronia marisminoris]
MFRFFENLVDPFAHHPDSDAPPRRLWPFLRDYSRPFTGIFVFAGLTSVAVAAIEILLIAYLGRVVNLLSDADPRQTWAEHGTELILVALAILFVRPVIQSLNVLLLNNAILPNFGTLFRWRAHSHVMRQSVGWFENDFAGRIANRIMQAPPAAGEAVFQVFDAMTYAVSYIVGAAILLSGADPRLVIPLLIWGILYGFLIRWVVRRVGPASEAAADARSFVTGRVVDSYSNIHSVKLFAHHDKEMEYGREAIALARTKFQFEMRLYTLMDVMLTVLNGVLTVGVVGWAIALWYSGAATVGVVATASALVMRLSGMTGWVMWAISSFFRNLGVVAEGMETIAQPIALTDHPGARPLQFERGEVRFDRVTHRYGRETGGLDGLDLTVRPGEKVGLVGRSGAGKSTLVKLLLRFYDAEQGRILIDGQDIGTVTQSSLRRQIGMVSQDSALLHRSVRDNILYGKPDATEAEVIAAARRAEAHEFIEGLSDSKGRSGYDALVGERGVKLSGGQRQRITLARVILKNAPILVLDEATSALDSEVETAIQETLYGVMEGKTVIAIAHRLSTIARMDRIVVIDEGRIVEEGAHDDLIRRDGLYARLWARQSGGFLDLEAAE